MLEHLNSNKVAPTRVVIMGAAGFVGSAVHRELLANNINAVALSRQQVDLLQPNAEHALTECLNDEDVLVVVSAIAPTKNYDQMISNIQMMRAVCEAVKQRKLSQIIYISSDAVYADGLSQVNENSNVQPSSFHGMMHAARELMFKSVAANVPLAILRPSALYGNNDPHNSYGPNRFARLAASAHEIKLFGNGEEKRDHVCIEDVAKIVALTVQNRSKGTLNIATGTSVSFTDIAQKIVKLSDSNSTVTGTPRQNPITHVHFDITACLQAFPEFKYTDLDSGLARLNQKAHSAA